MKNVIDKSGKDLSEILKLHEGPIVFCTKYDNFKEWFIENLIRFTGRNVCLSHPFSITHPFLLEKEIYEKSLNNSVIFTTNKEVIETINQVYKNKTLYFRIDVFPNKLKPYLVIYSKEQLEYSFENDLEIR